MKTFIVVKEKTNHLILICYWFIINELNRTIELKNFYSHVFWWFINLSDLLTWLQVIISKCCSSTFFWWFCFFYCNKIQFQFWPTQLSMDQIFFLSFFYLFFVQIWCIVSTETINKHELSCLSYMIIWFILVDNPKYIDHFYSDVRIINFGCRFFVEIFGCFVSFHDHIIMTLRIYLILHQCLISTKDNNPNIISWYWLLYLRK